MTGPLKMLLLLSPVLIFVISILNLMLRKCLNAPFVFGLLLVNILLSFI